MIEGISRSFGLVVTIVLMMASAAAAAPVKIAVFDFELVDSSLQGEIEGRNEEDLARLAMIETELKAALRESGRYQLIETDPADEAIAAAGNLHGCNGCEARLAEQLGAEQALVGWVQKVSNLILNLNIGIRDAASREKIFAASVDIRGNTDDSWLHGMRYLLKRRLLNE